MRSLLILLLVILGFSTISYSQGLNPYYDPSMSGWTIGAPPFLPGFTGHNNSDYSTSDMTGVSTLVKFTVNGQIIPESDRQHYAFYIVSYTNTNFFGNYYKQYTTVGDVIVLSVTENPDGSKIATFTQPEQPYDYSKNTQVAPGYNGTAYGGLGIMVDFAEIYNSLNSIYIEIFAIDTRTGYSMNSPLIGPIKNDAGIPTEELKSSYTIDIIDPTAGPQPTDPALAITNLFEPEESSEETPELLDFLVYPNPVEKGNSVLLTLNCPEDSLSGVLVEIYDHTGKCVLKKDAEGREVSIDDLKASGIYFIRVISPDGVSKTKRVQVK